MKAKYPQLNTPVPLKTIYSEHSITSTTISSGGSTSNALDMSSALKALQAISQNIVLDNLLIQLIKIVMENAGAQSSHLLLRKEGDWLIDTSASFETDMINVLQSKYLEDEQDKEDPIIPVNLVNYVITTEESIVLDNAEDNNQFSNDKYILVNSPKSILCFPFKHQGRLYGVLYLENNQTTHAFTPDRVELLQMLSSQIAISIENARLYKKLAESNHIIEEKVDSRNFELKE